MAYDVILRKKNNRYIARVRNWPELVTEEDSREEALIQIREQLAEYLSQPPEIVQVDLETETNIDHPWLQFAGMWSDDETWDDFLSEVERYRKEADNAVAAA